MVVKEDVIVCKELLVQSGNTASRGLSVDVNIQNDGNSITVRHDGTLAFATLRNDDITIGGALYLFGNWLWVDATGNLRIHTSNPTSDTAGTVVGTQS